MCPVGGVQSKGIISEWLQIDTIELNLRFTKIFLFSAVDPLSKLYYLRAYQRATSFNARDFLFRLTYLHDERIKYLQIDNGSEWEKWSSPDNPDNKLRYFF